MSENSSVTSQRKSIFQEFKEFAIRGNMVELAVGLIVGASFNTTLKSFVDGIVMPPIGWIVGRVDFADLYIHLGRGKYASLIEAKEAGAPVVTYGIFLNNLVTFLITAIVVFFVIKVMNRLRRQEEIEERKNIKQTPS